jgi:enolase-phosphatase E1
LAPRAVLLDIEGTTTDIAFVHKVLFPYARERIAAFVRDHAAAPEVAEAISEIRASEGNLSLDEIGALLIRWIGEDRKAKPLKTIQGLIWHQGYEAGVLKAHVYADVAPALRRWHGAGHALYVYSSGSVAAQKLLFANTPAGDLTPLFSGYFDTAVGAKLESDSYRKISAALKRAPDSILFLSDHAGELAAAKGAGLRALRLDRGRAADAPPDRDESVPVVGSFAWIDPSRDDGLAQRAFSTSSLM